MIVRYRLYCLCGKTTNPIPVEEVYTFYSGCVGCLSPMKVIGYYQEESQDAE